MGVTTGIHNDMYNHRQKSLAHTPGVWCTFCAAPLQYPFLHWHISDQNFVFLCGKCCLEIKRGLIADLIHLEAAKTLSQLCPNETLSREDINQAEHRWRRINGGGKEK
jgi:hypothetical protein